MNRGNTNTTNMSFSPSFPDGPSGEQMKDLLIFYETFHEGPFGYLFVDEHARALHFNNKACELLCIDPALLPQKSIFDFILEEEHPRLRELIDNSSDHFQQPLRMVKARCKRRAHQFVTIYLKKIKNETAGTPLYVMIFLKNDFNPLSASKEENEAFYKAIIETQEAEREYIGASLHDSIAQELYAIRINLQRFLMENGHEEQIMPIKKMLNDTIFKVQHISNELMPAVLRDMGFQKAIDDMIFRISRPEVKFAVRIGQDISKVSREVQFCCYRIVQELFNNCLKHAAAKHISLLLHVQKNEISIQVDDDGHGFSREVNAALQLGTGLRNIRNRIALYAGTMDMVSSGKGSKIKIKLYT